MPCLTCSIDEPVLRYDGFHIKKSNKLQWVYNHSMVTISNRLEISHGHSRKNGWELRSYFFKKTWDFSFFYFILGNSSKKQSSTPANSARLCYIPWKFHGKKSSSPPPPPPCKSQIPHYFFLFTPGNSACYFFDTPGDSI